MSNDKTESLAEVGSFLLDQFSVARIKESIKGNKTTALCILLVFSGGFYSVYKRIFAPLRDDTLSTVTQRFVTVQFLLTFTVKRKETKV